MSETIKPIDEDLEKINIFDPELMACPHAFFKKLRDEAPVYQDPNTGIFQVSKHELICKVARDAKLFSNQFGTIQRSEAVIILKKLLILWLPMDILLSIQCLLQIHQDIQVTED